MFLELLWLVLIPLLHKAIVLNDAKVNFSRCIQSIILFNSMSCQRVVDRLDKKKVLPIIPMDFLVSIKISI